MKPPLPIASSQKQKSSANDSAFEFDRQPSEEAKDLSLKEKADSDDQFYIKKMNTENTGTLTNLVSGLNQRHESADKPQELDNDTSILSNQIQSKGRNKLINE
jgi:hypothetical protein